MGSARQAAIALLAVLASAATAAAAPPARRLIGPGDLVAGFGRIGGGGFATQGLDDAGRALIRAGEHGEHLLWASEAGLVAALDPAVTAAALWVDVLDVAPSGAFVFRLGEGGEHVLYAAAGGALRRVAATGERDAGGAELCRLRSARINDAGAVAVEALVAPRTCDPPEDDSDSSAAFAPAAYFSAGEGLQRLPRAGAILALTDDGRAVLESGDLVDAGGVRPSLPNPAIGPSGGRIVIQGIHAASRRGALVFWGSEAGKTGLYRGDADGIVKLFAAGDPAPWGGLHLSEHAQWLQSVQISTAGDVLAITSESFALFFPAAGAPQRLAGYALGGGWLNDRGQVALETLTSAAGARAVERWTGAARTRLVGSGDPLPGGGHLVSHGLWSRCIGPDGSVAVVADATPDAQGLLCGDADGFRASVRVGDGTPVGRRFHAFGACAIARAGEIVFEAHRLLPAPEPNTIYTYYAVEAALYRATAAGVERILGPGDQTSDGAVVAAVGRLSNYGAPFSVNARGDLLAFARLSDATDGAAVLLREAGGALRRIPLPARGAIGTSGIGFPPGFPLDHEYLAGLRDLPRGIPGDGAAGRSAVPRAAMPTGPTRGEPLYDLQDAHLLADGSVAALAGPTDEYGRRATQVLIVGANGVDTLFTTDDPPFAERQVERFAALAVAGDRLVLQSTGRQRTDVYTWRRGAAAAERLFGSQDAGADRPSRSLQLIGVSGDGRVVIGDYRADRPVFRAWQAGVFQDLASFAHNENWATNLGADGTLLLQDGSGAVLALGDAVGGASCPVPPTIVLPTRTVTATPTVAPTVTATPPATATRSATPLATAAPCDASTPACLRIGSARAAAGGAASIDVHLEVAEGAIAGTQNELLLPASVRVVGCAVNPAIDKPSSAFRVDGTRLRALVLALDNVAPIASGARLYTCTLAIDAALAAGTYPIGCADAETATPVGGSVRTGCAPGLLTIEAVATATPPASTVALTGTPAAADNPATGAGSAVGASGCAVTPPAGTSSAWLLLGAAPLLPRRLRR